MDGLINELNEFEELLSLNSAVDWSENDPSEEFEALSEKLKAIIEKHSK